MECYTCLNISGERPISPAPFIYEGTYWIVDHAYPSSLKGWLVILLKRHAEALHELSSEEFAELADIQYKLIQVMHELPHVQKEYIMCIAEGEHFHHIHVHVVAKPVNLPSELKGPRIFAMINIDEAHAVPADELRAFCQDFTNRLDKYSE